MRNFAWQDEDGALHSAAEDVLAQIAAKAELQELFNSAGWVLVEETEAGWTEVSIS